MLEVWNEITKRDCVVNVTGDLKGGYELRATSGDYILTYANKSDDVVFKSIRNIEYVSNKTDIAKDLSLLSKNLVLAPQFSELFDVLIHDISTNDTRMLHYEIVKNKNSLNITIDVKEQVIHYMIAKLGDLYTTNIVIGGLAVQCKVSNKPKTKKLLELLKVLK